MLEVSIFDFFRDDSSVIGVITALVTHCMVPYDVMRLLYRPRDVAHAQIDLGFVPKSGVLRRQHSYATPEQRHERNAAMRASSSSGPAGRR